MMSMPFTLLASFSGYMYWLVRKARAAAQSPAANSQAPDSPPAFASAEEAESEAVQGCSEPRLSWPSCRAWLARFSVSNAEPHRHAHVVLHRRAAPLAGLKSPVRNCCQGCLVERRSAARFVERKFVDRAQRANRDQQHDHALLTGSAGVGRIGRRGVGNERGWQIVVFGSRLGAGRSRRDRSLGDLLGYLFNLRELWPASFPALTVLTGSGVGSIGFGRAVGGGGSGTVSSVLVSSRRANSSQGVRRGTFNFSASSSSGAGSLSVAATVSSSKAVSGSTIPTGCAAWAATDSIEARPISTRNNCGGSSSAEFNTPSTLTCKTALSK